MVNRTGTRKRRKGKTNRGYRNHVGGFMDAWKSSGAIKSAKKWNKDRKAAAASAAANAIKAEADATWQKEREIREQGEKANLEQLEQEEEARKEILEEACRECDKYRREKRGKEEEIVAKNRNQMTRNWGPGGIVADYDPSGGWGGGGRRKTRRGPKKPKKTKRRKRRRKTRKK
jgi:hypothetical protein